MHREDRQQHDGVLQHGERGGRVHAGGGGQGIDPDVLNQVIRSSSGDSFGFRAVAHKALRGDWSQDFALDLAYKDLHLALELADEIGIPLPLAVQTHNLMRMARGMGLRQRRHDGDDAGFTRNTLKREVRGKPREG